MSDLPAGFESLKQGAIESVMVFAGLVGAVRVCSRSQIADTLFEVGERCRRNT